MTKFYYGWNQPHEVLTNGHANLVATEAGAGSVGGKRFGLSHYRYYQVPREVDQRKHAIILDQKVIGACSGESRSSAGYYVYGTAHRWRKTLEFSGRHAYITNQEQCGLAGEDKGATIAGSAKAAKEDGFCPLSLCPYFEDGYDSNLSDEVREAGKQHKIGSHSVISSYEDAIQYLGTVGVLNIGMPVGKNFQECKGILTKEMVMEDARDPEGGHALCLPGYLLPESIGQRGDRAYIYGQNSWTDKWGHHGHFYIEPEAFEYLMSLIPHGEVECVGFTHLEDFDDPNPIDHGGDDEVIV
jgi:Papain family cysteine protease